MSMLTRLAEPFPARFVQQKPGSFKADYVSHSEVSQALLEIVGPHCIEVREVVMNDGKVEGAIVALTCTIDDKRVRVEEAGAIERKTDNAGERLKDCISDGIKRCAMRIGLGLHLWAGDNYYLHARLSGEADPKPKAAPKAAPRPAESGKQRHENVDNGNSGCWTGFIESVKTREGNTKGRDWKMWIVKGDDGEEFVTFSETDGGMAESAGELSVMIDWEIPSGKKGKKITCIQPAP